MSILDGIANSSNRAAAGYFQNMQAADERDANAFNRRRIEQSDAYAAEDRGYAAEDRNYVNKQRKFERMKAAAEEAVDFYIGAGDMPDRDDQVQRFMTEAAMDIGLDPNQDFVTPIKGKVAQLQGGDRVSLNPTFAEGEDGGLIAVQLTEGGPRVVPLPQGATRWASGSLAKIDQGNQTTLVDPRTGRPQSTFSVNPSPEQMPEFRAGVRTAETIAGEQTPGGQADLEAQRLANQQAAQKASEATRKVELAQQAKQDMAELVQEIAGMDISPVYGSIQGGMYSLRSGTVDAESAITRLGRMLTVDNLAKMSGVLTDTDVRILSEAATELQNFRISDERASKEVRRIARVFGIDIPGDKAVPDDVTPEQWSAMTPEERKLWR